METEVKTAETAPAAKKAKRKPTKPKGEKKPVKSKAKKKAKAKRKPAAGVVRPERLDMRLSKAEKIKLVTKAKKLRRTVTSLVIEAIEKIK